jgi:hypothetical protein
MDLLQAAEEDSQRMTHVWLGRLPSVEEFMAGIDDPKHWRARPVSYLPGAYTQAASVLMEKMISLVQSDEPLRASALLPPYLYLRRHHFEMQLKSILRIVAGNADNSSRWSEATGVAPGRFDDKVRSTHSLQRLWGQVQPMAEAVWVSETHWWQPPRLTVPDVSELIRQLHAIDPKGDGIRYARDLNGEVTMLGVSRVGRVDLEHADRNMLDIAEFLWWVRREIGATVIDPAYGVDEADRRRFVIWQAGSDEVW